MARRVAGLVTPQGRDMGIVCRVSLVAITSALLGCGGKGATAPSDTTPSSGPPAAPVNLTVGDISARNRTVRLGWSAPSTNRNYVIELGSSSGLADVAVLTTRDNADFLVLTEVRSGRTFARVKAQNAAGTSGASNEASFFVPDFQNFVEALFLGTGPMQAQSGVRSCPSPNPVAGRQVCNAVAVGYPRGVTVRGRVWSGISEPSREAVRTALAQVAEATGGGIGTSFEVTDSQPTPAVNEMTFGLMEPASLCRGSEACTIPSSLVPGILRSSRAVFSASFAGDPTRTASFAHEVGHGLLGMYHVDSASVGGDQASIMSTSPGGTSNLPSRFTSLDVEATQALYSAGLGGGATRSQLVAAGLIKP